MIVDKVDYNLSWFNLGLRISTVVTSSTHHWLRNSVRKSHHKAGDTKTTNIYDSGEKRLINFNNSNLKKKRQHHHKSFTQHSFVSLFWSKNPGDVTQKRRNLCDRMIWVRASITKEWKAFWLKRWSKKIRRYQKSI